MSSSRYGQRSIGNFLPNRVPGVAQEIEERASRSVRPARWLTGGAVGRAQVRPACGFPLEAGGYCGKSPHHRDMCGGQ